jgi:hypothetical protein
VLHQFDSARVYNDEFGAAPDCLLYLEADDGVCFRSVSANGKHAGGFLEVTDGVGHGS